MRKKLALLLAAIMVIGMVPMTAFATTTNRISKVVSGDTDTDLNTETKAPVLKMYEKDLKGTSGQSIAFELNLANAEWLDEVVATNGVSSDGKVTIGSNACQFITGITNPKVTKLSAKDIIIQGTINGDISISDDTDICVAMLTSLTDEGDATVTIDPMESVISSGTYKFATVTSGSTTTTVEKKADISESGGDLKNIVIKESNAGAIDAGTGKLKLKLSSNWSFTKDPTITVYPKDSVVADTANIDRDDENCTIPVTVTETDVAKTITIACNVKYDDDDVDPGDVCEMTVSGENGLDIDKTTLDVATAVTYGVAFTAEDKTVPTFYSGQADPDKDTLKVTMKETVADSWLYNRKTKIVFPEGVKVLGVDMTPKDHCSNATYSIDNDEDHGEVEFTVANKDTDGKAKIEFKFQLSIAPSYTGDIKATLTGAGVEDDVEAVVGTVVAPVTVEAESTNAVIDYRHTTVGDITITEAEAGILKKDTTLQLEVEDLDFDNDPKIEVTSGDLKVNDVTTDGGKVKIKIKSESAKEPGVIKLTGCELYMERSVPAGTYALKLSSSHPYTYTSIDEPADDIEVSKDTDGNVIGYSIKYWDENDAVFENSCKSGGTYKNTPLFDSRSIKVCPGYVDVVTAGSDVGNTFTTQIKVTIGANQMTAGNNTINLDVPAYINNGYTMLPVRAVTEALSSAAIVRWDDATKTVTIAFGSRVVSMTVGSKTMTINGVGVAMQSQCEITDSRAFIPLRDLGYALGLNDSKINWDDATKTATLN
ncbi:MAG: copper amine oxidase N-terminal domain-containing protein [Clostridia bacterium]|jgi:hypothetical protein|nr:copper amine oxidase N-terminal domain-containing protein [Clostridia bacterium]